MQFLRNLSIKWKLIVVQLFVVLLVIILQDIFMVYNEQRTYRKSIMLEARSIAELMAANSIPTLLFFDNSAARQILATLETDERIVNARIFDAQDSLFAIYDQTGYESFKINIEEINDIDITGDFLTLAQPIIDIDQKIGTVLLRLEMLPISEKIKQSALTATVVLIVALVVAFLLAMTTQRTISNPILLLVDKAKQVSEKGDYSIRLDKEATDEIGTLYDGFNEMLEEIQAREVERDKAQQDLEKLNDELELRVQRRTDDLEKARSAAEAANRAKSVFLANMSHEIRTPMNAILGYSQLMQRDPELSSEQQQSLNTINRSGEHLLALINEILEMSKIEAGRVKLNPVTFNLHKLLDDLETMFRVRTDQKNLELKFSRTSNVMQYIKGDEGKIRQVLINLLGNAVKFTDDGQISLSASTEALDENKEAEYRLVFRVNDTGIGIAEENITQIFQSFEQAQTGIRTEGGTGLGLAISREYARMMGGEINVESQPGIGSSFILRIDVSGGDIEDEKAQIPLARVIGIQNDEPEYRVIVADDRETNRDILTRMLLNVGFKVKAVTNGREAVELFKSWKPQVILMDMVMPDLDGREATQEIRSLSYADEVVIIAVTASVFEDERSSILAKGANAFIRKPFKEGELFEEIRQHTSIKFIYERSEVTEDSESVPLTADSIKKFPEDLRSRILKSAMIGDTRILKELIKECEEYDNSVAQGLAKLAEAFDLKRIMKLFEPHAK